jgi:hypothetical protein
LLSSVWRERPIGSNSGKNGRSSTRRKRPFRAKSFRRERLRADVLSLASDAMATLRELVSGPDVPPSVRLRASLAILEAADALNVEEIGPTTAEAVQANIEHKRFIDSLG